MIHIDLTNDAPMVEVLDGSGLFQLTTIDIEGEEDDVAVRLTGERDWSTVPFLTSAKVRSTSGKTYYVHERDLFEFGLYTVKCWTRAGVAREYRFRLGVGETNRQFTITIEPDSTPCSWVTENEVYASKGSLVEIHLEVP